jgi:hypothetical protein
MIARIVATVVFVLAVVLVPAPVVHAQDVSAMAQLTAYREVLAELQRVLDHTIRNVDVVAENRLESAKNKVNGLLKQLDDLQKGVITNVNDVLYNVATGTHEVMADVRKTIRTTERTAFLDVNSSLINATRLLSAVPFAKNVKPYIAATEPMRISPKHFDRRLYFYGYFPDVTEKDRAKVQVGGQSYDLKVYGNNRLGFDLPPTSLKEESFVELTVTIPRRSWWKLVKTDIVVNERVYVQKLKPFALRVLSFVDNPAGTQTLTPPQPFRASATSDTPSVIRDVSAGDLFTALVPNAGDFRLDTVRITDVSAQTAGGRPCEHAPMSAEFRGWDSGGVRFALQAGSVGPHWHNLPDHCVDWGLLGKHCVPQGFMHGGGGSNADIVISPVFAVRRKDVPDVVAAEPVTSDLQYNDVGQVPIPATWHRVELLVSFKDGGEEWKQPLVLSRLHLGDSRPAWSARVEGETLTVQTRSQ